MTCVKRWFIVMVVGGTFIMGLTSCVVVPVDPVPPGYVVSPPVVVIRPYHHYHHHRHYRPYHHYRPYRYYRPHRPYGGWYGNPYRW